MPVRAMPTTVRRCFAVIPLVVALVLTLGYGGVLPAWYLPADVVLALALAGWILWDIRQPQMVGSWRPITYLAGLFPLLPLVQITLHATVQIAATQHDFLRLLAMTSAFLLAWQASADRAFRDGALRSLAIAAGVLGGWALIQWNLFPEKILGLRAVTVAVPMGTFVNRDHFAASIELLFPATLALAAGEGDEAMSYLTWGLPAALALAAVVVSASRGGVGILGLELVSFFVWRRWRQRAAVTAGQARPGSSRRSEGRRWAWLAPLGLGLMLVSFTVSAGYQRFLERFHESTLNQGERLRLDLSSLQMALGHPLLGSGLGTWQLVYPRYASFDNGEVFGHAHSEYLEWLDETGILGVALALAFGLALWRTWSSRPGLEAGLFVTALLPGEPALWALRTALLGFALNAATDFFVHIPALAVTAAAVAGLACGSPDASPRISEPVSINGVRRRSAADRRQSWAMQRSAVPHPRLHA